jgi:hypothetical protein
MGKRILELKNNVHQCHLFAESLTVDLKSKFSVNMLFAEYQRVFAGDVDVDVKKWQAAA